MKEDEYEYLTLPFKAYMKRLADMHAYTYSQSVLVGIPLQSSNVAMKSGRKLHYILSSDLLCPSQHIF